MLRNLAFFFAGRYVLNHLSSTLTSIGVPYPIRLTVYAILVFTALLLTMWYFQEGILYQPSVPVGLGTTVHRPDENPEGMKNPSQQGLQYEELSITASDGVKISAWFIPSGANSPALAPTIIFSHENAGNMGLRLDEFKRVHQETGANILLYDYRGYGNSDEVPIDETGIMKDARAVWDWALSRGALDKSRLFLYGRSLGGAVAIQLACQLCKEQASVVPAGLIVGNTFTSIERLVGKIYPFLNFEFVRQYMLRLQWRSIEHIRHVTVPIMMIVGLKDEIVPASHTPELKQAAINAVSVDVFTVADGMHNDTWLKAGPHYFERLQRFMTSASARSERVDQNLLQGDKKAN